MKIITKLALSVALAAGIAAPFSATEAAQAAAHHKPVHHKNPACITKKEFGRVHRGMTPARVRQIVGGWGRVEGSANYGGYRAVERSYTVCAPFNRYSAVEISFSANPRKAFHMDGKAAYWLHN